MCGLLLLVGRPGEPEYQGKKLSAWLKMLQPYGGEERPATTEEADRKQATVALRALGPKALPWLLRWMRQSPGNSWRDRIQEVLEKQSVLTIRLPEPEDRSALAIWGFEALGTDATPAVPELQRWLGNSRRRYDALQCLNAIGPAALPVFAAGLTNSDPLMQSSAIDFLERWGNQIGPPAATLLVSAITNPSCSTGPEAVRALGNLGPDALPYRGLLQGLMRDSQERLAGPAMRTEVALSPSPEQYLPVLQTALLQTNLASHAAFALLQTGPEGVAPLVRALTNEHAVIRKTALVALNLAPARVPSGPRIPFSWQSRSFDTKLIPNTLGYRPKMDAIRICDTLAANLENPSAAVRLEIVQALAGYGRPAAAGLSRAAKDPESSVSSAAQAALAALDVEVREGAIVRGPKNQKQIALVFTAHEFAEGADAVFGALARHQAEASFFLTGDCLRKFKGLGERVITNGHYLGPHSDKHPLYCDWANPQLTFITQLQFWEDFVHNLSEIGLLSGGGAVLPAYFVPPYEHYNLEIVKWANNFYYITLNLTPGTRSAADYTGEGDRNFVSSRQIFESIIAREAQDPHGLNGFVLLFHLGSGSARTDKFHDHLGDLLDSLAAKGYRFVAVDEMFDPASARERRLLQQNSTKRNADQRAFRRRDGLPP